MHPIIITNCTQRKRGNCPANARMASNRAAPPDVWISALSSDTIRLPARERYCGRSFKEALAATAAVSGHLWIVSAGLGLVHAETPIPIYEATAVGNQENSIPVDASEWFSALQAHSPFASTPNFSEATIVFAALSSPYLRMVGAWLERVVATAPGRLRIFSRINPADVPPALRDSLMPYDTRLDDPALGRAGTVSDFAQRAMRDFVETVFAEQPLGSLADHRAAVAARLAPRKPPARQKNLRAADEEIRQLIRKHWKNAEGLSGRMLALLRGPLGIACEQGRFASLFKQVAAEVRGH